MFKKLKIFFLLFGLSLFTFNSFSLTSPPIFNSGGGVSISSSTNLLTGQIIYSPLVVSNSYVATNDSFGRLIGGSILITPIGPAMDTSNIQAALDSITNTGGGTVVLYPTNHYWVSNLTIYANTTFDCQGSTLHFISGVTNFEINIDKGATETVTNYSFVNFKIDGQSVSNFVSPPLQAFLGANFGLWPYYFDVSQGKRQMPNRSGILVNAYGKGTIRGSIKGFDGFGIALFNSKGNGTAFNHPKVDTSGLDIDQCFYGYYQCKGGPFDFPASWGYQPPNGDVCVNQDAIDVHIHNCAVGANMELYGRFLGGSLTDNDIGVALLDDNLVLGTEFNHDTSYSVVFAGAGVGHLNRVVWSYMYASAGVLDITGNNSGRNEIAFNAISASSFNIVSTNQGNLSLKNNWFAGGWDVANGAQGIRIATATSTNFVWGHNTPTDSYTVSDNVVGGDVFLNFIPALNMVGTTNRPFTVVTNTVADHKPTNWWFYYDVSGVVQPLYHSP